MNAFTEINNKAVSSKQDADSKKRGNKLTLKSTYAMPYLKATFTTTKGAYQAKAYGQFAVGCQKQAPSLGFNALSGDTEANT